MSIPSLSRPSLAVWPMLPSGFGNDGAPALMRLRPAPMDSSANESATPDSGTGVGDDVATPTPISVDDSQQDGSSDDMDFEQDAPASETDETGALDALHVPLLEDQEHDGSIELADDDVEMITMSDAESDGLKREADLEDRDESDAGDEASDEAEDRPHANGGPPSVDAAIQELVNDNDRLSRAVSSQHATIEELRKQLHQATTQLAATEQRLLVVSQDLAASRSFVAKEDVDGQQIRTVFNDLNEAVDDHTFLLLDAVPDPPEGATLDVSSALALLSSHELVRKELYHFVSAALVQKMPLMDFCAFFIPALLNVVLLRVVFRPFIPGLDAARSAHLHAFYDDICRKEPQDRAARWRSITYAQTYPRRDDAALVAHAVDLFYSALESSLPHVVSSDAAGTLASLRTQYLSAAAKIVRDALKLQDLAMATYISFDYRLIAPPVYSIVTPSQTEVAELVKRCPHSLPRTDPAEDGEICLAVVSFGLLASKSTQRSPSDMVERAVTVMKKASVVAATCRWARAHTSS